MSLTGKTGQYQDQVNALPSLPLNRYERIFKLFTQPINGKEFYFYNILNKMEFPDNIVFQTHSLIVKGLPFSFLSF